MASRWTATLHYERTSPMAAAIVSVSCTAILTSSSDAVMKQHRTAVTTTRFMGQRMLGNMHKYPGFTPVIAWDPDTDACRATRERYPDLEIAADAAHACTLADVDCVYIACPPRFHAEHALCAFEAPKAVWCEKPLGVHIAQSTALTEAAVRSGQKHIVNFSLASAMATGELERAVTSGAFGDIQHIDLRLHFARWPRDWQAAAASWLAFRHEGGFTREVVSHWVYLTMRVFGMPALRSSQSRFGDGELAETHLLALLDVAGVPFSIAASTGGVGPDIVEYTVQGSRQGFRIRDWNVPLVSDGKTWTSIRTDVADPREAGYATQLDNAANAIAGKAHSMPDFRTALDVQRLIEAMLMPAGHRASA